MGYEVGANRGQPGPMVPMAPAVHLRGNGANRGHHPIRGGPLAPPCTDGLLRASKGGIGRH